MRIIGLISAVILIPFLIGCGSDDDPVEPAVPTGVVAVNGEYYRLQVGDSAITPPLRFKVVDAGGNAVAGQLVEFTLLEGDGTLSADSATIGSSLYTELNYEFSDSVGHAVIKATSGSLDSAEVVLRKSMLIPGQGGQGQFILLSDTYGMIKAYNGEPDTLIVDPEYFRLHAVYESTLGVVFIIEDVDQDDVADDNETIEQIIVNDNEDSNPDNDYKGTTKDGIGIGSTFAECVAALGSPDDTVPDVSEWPPYWLYRWRSIGLVVYTTYDADPAGRDTLDVREIHLLKPGLLSPSHEYQHVSKDR